MEDTHLWRHVLVANDGTDVGGWCTTRVMETFSCCK
jgi:hypothetical protein